MAVPVVLRCGGLMTDPNPLLTAEMGALRIASDIIIERPGVASQRPNFGLLASKSSSQRPRVFATRTSDVFVSTWDGASTWRIETSAASISSQESEPIDYTYSFPQFAEARRNLYWCSKAGMHRIAANGDVGAANMHEAPSGYLSTSTAGSPVVLANNFSTAWRWCFTRRDATNDPSAASLRSAPSPWMSFGNTSGSTIDMNLLIPLPAYVVAGDQIEVYRTNQVSGATATPSDQMYLARRYTVTSSDVSGGVATVLDSTADADLDQELYSNATREGALKINSRPPAARALALWEECMWFGGTIGPWTCIFDVKKRAGSAAADGTVGFGRFQYAAIVADGTPTLTGFASTNSIVVGQLATDSGTPGGSGGTIPIGTFVISKTATTVTLDQNAAINAGFTASFHDRIKVGSENFYASSSTSTSGGLYPTFSVAISGDRSTAQQIAYSISANSSSYYAMAVYDPSIPPDVYEARISVGSVVIRQVAQFGSAPTVTLYTTSTSYSAQTDASGNLVVSRDDKPCRLFYSKPREPEHVPEPVNWIDVGNEFDAILALVPLRAALLVFKQDGIFRITGSPPDGWRVDLLDPGNVILRGECVDTTNNLAYAWTNRGIIEVDESGVRSISDGKIARELDAFTFRRLSNTTTTACWVRCWPSKQLVLVGTPAAAEDKSTTTIYAYHTGTQAWTTWAMSAYCVGYRRNEGSLLLARGGAFWELRKAQMYSSDHGGFDRNYSIAAWTVNGTTITVTDANRGDWVPKADDWIVGTVNGALEFRRVSAAVDTGTSYDLTIDSAFSATPSADRVAFEGIPSIIQWQAVTMGKPTRAKFCNRMHVLLEWVRLLGTYTGTTARMLVGGATDVTSTVATVTSSSETRAVKVFDLVAAPPRNIARGAHFFPYIKTSDIAIEWRCYGIGLDFAEGTESERTNR